MYLFQGVGKLSLEVFKWPTSCSGKIDYVARIAFPVVFALFIIIYFADYSNAADDDLPYGNHTVIITP